MSNETPLEQMGEQVTKFFSENGLPEGAFITGWALIVSTARIQSEQNGLLPLADGTSYALGPETSLVQAAGMAQFLKTVCDRSFWERLDDAEEDDANDEAEE